MPRPAVAGASIRFVAKETGIAPDTLRVWERRYGFPAPMRRAGGSRLYSTDDVARLKLVRRAMEGGCRAGDVVPLAARDLEHLISSMGPKAPTLAAGDSGLMLDAAVRALAADDVLSFRAQLRAAALSLGPRAFVIQIAHPLAVRVGQLWARGQLEVRHEHLASACLETQLRLLSTAFDEGQGAPVTLLTTLPAEPHVLGLEMIAVLVSVARGSPRMLGGSTPAMEIVTAAEALRADVVGLSVSPVADFVQVRADIEKMRKRLPASRELWVGGGGAESVVDPKTEGIRIVSSFADLDRAIAAY